ncbi:MAG: deoxyribodipyrimidine photo-lyase, partial [Ramlibacter sp.]|nr:deoxyribodipyrimidine photo-lyase [Ramlibacter sp.]
HALRSCGQVHAAFIFDSAILDELPRADRRVEFIRDSVAALDEDLRLLAKDEDAGIIARHADSVDEMLRLAAELGVQAVFANHDDEPLALARDQRIREVLQHAGIAFHTFKDHTIFERQEVMTQAGTPYTVFTPYKRSWLAKVDAFYLKSYTIAPHAASLMPRPASMRRAVPTLAELKFQPTNLNELQLATGSAGGRGLLNAFAERIADYADTRDFPAMNGASLLGVHLRFGTVSIRELARRAHASSAKGSDGAATWLGELIWRDFFFQILANFPHVAGKNHAGANFRPAYNAIKWEEGPHADELFAAWCEGRTGYPLVDAAMAQINRTGYMHNRLRMVVASFLTKDLGIDWRRGERYFAQHLNDYELSSNNGNWQWAASTGCDAQPWFRIFNPVSQSKKFDADGRFITSYLPQLAGLAKDAIHEPWAHGVKGYPAPIVKHDEAREKTLKRYGAALK